MDLFISDLDKTLLNNNASLSDYSRTELNRMIKNNLQFSIATARGHISATQILNGLDLKLPIVVSNGSFITDFKTGEILMMQSIHDSIKEEVLDILLRIGTLPFISSSDGKSFFLYHTQLKNEGSHWYLDELIRTKDPRREEVKNLKQSLEKNVISFTAIDKREKIENAFKILKNEFGQQLEMHYYENPYHKDWLWLSIHDINASKKTGLEKLNELLGNSACDLTVFGDNVNDIPMFEYAERKVAVENAIPELKALASHITKSNEEHGVVDFIKSAF